MPSYSSAVLKRGEKLKRNMLKAQARAKPVQAEVNISTELSPKCHSLDSGFEFACISGAALAVCSFTDLSSFRTVLVLQRKKKPTTHTLPKSTLGICFSIFLFVVIFKAQPGC